MKSYNNLFKEVIDPINIQVAINRASLGKRHRADVKAILDTAEFHIHKIRNLLLNKIYPCRLKEAIKFYDTGSRKERIMIKPDFAYEQIIQHMVMQVLIPIFMKGMYKYSCGSVPERGLLYGKKYLEKQIRKRKELRYVIKLDIHHFYQSIDINLIKQKLAKLIRDRDMLWLLYQILDSNIAILNNEKINFGLPVGYYTSQWIANWFLQDLDHAIKRESNIVYVRYLDDMVILTSNKKHAWKILLLINNILHIKHLKLKQNYQIFKFHYIDKFGKNHGRFIDFMGFRFYRNRTVLRKRLLFKATRKAKRLFKKGKFSWYEACQFLSYTGWFKHTDTYNIWLKYIKPFISVKRCKRKISYHSKKEKNNVNKIS